MSHVIMPAFNGKALALLSEVPQLPSQITRVTVPPVHSGQWSLGVSMLDLLSYTPNIFL